jgi:hypothetical protein
VGPRTSNQNSRATVSSLCSHEAMYSVPGTAARGMSRLEGLHRYLAASASLKPPPAAAAAAAMSRQEVPAPGCQNPRRKRVAAGFHIFLAAASGNGNWRDRTLCSSRSAVVPSCGHERGLSADTRQHRQQYTILQAPIAAVQLLRVGSSYGTFGMQRLIFSSKYRLSFTSISLKIDRHENGT